jgi:transposase
MRVFLMTVTQKQTSERKQKKKSPTATTPGIDDHNMKVIGVGIDTARYGHHVTFLREDKQPACLAITVMETRTGYQQLRTQIEALHQRFPNAHIYVRIDAAGQYAANLENFLRALTHLPLSISVGEPKRNKDYHAAHSPKRQSDATESYAMARYAVVERPTESHGTPPQFAVLRRVASRLQSQTKQSTRLINQLHETLSASFPELATHISDLAANWVLLLLEKYPTAHRLAETRLSSIQKIKFIPAGMPEKLHDAAKHSVGTLSGDAAEGLIQELVGELQHSLGKEKRWRELLAEAFDALPEGAHHQIVSIKGIGKQTAAAIVATAIDINRFETDKQLVGYFGIFPMELQSGVDKLGRPIPPGKKIMCRKGNDMVRGLLWQCAKCASAITGGNPAVRDLYLRRLAAGDSSQVAWGYCMAKLLRQVYGVWSSDTPFNPQYEAKKRLAPETQIAAPGSPSEKTETSGPKLDTHNESACEEVTDVSASLEPVTAASPVAASPEIYGAKNLSRPPIDFKILREKVPLQQVLERIGRVPVRTVQHRGPCPIHEPNSTTGRKFSANLKRQVFRCFDPNCGAQGNVLDLWQAFKKRFQGQLIGGMKHFDG